jgi:hypothetical protein
MAGHRRTGCEQPRVHEPVGALLGARQPVPRRVSLMGTTDGRELPSPPFPVSQDWAAMAPPMFVATHRLLDRGALYCIVALNKIRT